MGARGWGSPAKSTWVARNFPSRMTWGYTPHIISPIYPYITPLMVPRIHYIPLVNLKLNSPPVVGPKQQSTASVNTPPIVNRALMGVSQNRGNPFFGGPYNKDYSILGSILGSPYFGKLPYTYSKFPVVPITGWGFDPMDFSLSELDSLCSRIGRPHGPQKFPHGG